MWSKISEKFHVTEALVMLTLISLGPALFSAILFILIFRVRTGG
jgi:hypothetical protein